jgi:hypothetical protein
MGLGQNSSGTFKVDGSTLYLDFGCCYLKMHAYKIHKSLFCPTYNSIEKLKAKTGCGRM